MNKIDLALLEAAADLHTDDVCAVAVNNLGDGAEIGEMLVMLLARG